VLNPIPGLRRPPIQRSNAHEWKAVFASIHSDTDAVNPVSGAREIFAAAQQPKKLVILHGYEHNAVYSNPTEEWWGAVLAFMSSRNP